MHKPSYSAVASTLALVFSLAALCVGGAVASGVIVTGKQIKNGTISSLDLRNNGVKSADLKNGTVDSADIGNGEVEPQDVTMPAPNVFKVQGFPTVFPTLAFAKVGDVGTYTKQDSTSALEVHWDGLVEGHNGGEASGCFFQIRVNGKVPSGGSGEAFGKGIVSVSPTALFLGEPAGPEAIEVWARLAKNERIGEPSPFDSCTVGPLGTTFLQSFVAVESPI